MTVGSTSHDTDETPVGSIDQALDLVQSRGGYVQILLNGQSSILTHLQVFISAGAGEPLFVEFTFFPQDLIPRIGLFDASTSWASALCATLGGTHYWVGYENASWEFGDASPTSGVFLVQDIEDATQA